MKIFRILPASVPSLSVDVAQRIRSEQLALAYERMRPSAVMTLVVAGYFTWLLDGTFPEKTLHWWLAAIAIVNLLRLALWSSYRRMRPAPEHADRWASWFVVGVAAAGCAWSTGVYVLLPQAQGYEVAMLLVTLLSVSSAAAASLSMHLVSYCTFMVIMLVPSAIWLSLQPGNTQVVAAAMWAALGVLLVTGYLGWLSNVRFIKTKYDLEHALLTAAEAKTVAEDASRAKSRFLANMSHEVRTPLNGVLGMTEILGASNLDAAQRRQVELLQQSAHHLLGVVNGILDLAKVEAGRMIIEQRPLKLAVVVSEAVELFRDTASRKGLRLDYSLSADIPAQVTGDVLRLRQVLANLISNAVKCTATGGVTISVRLERQIDSGYCLRFEVSDTGAGIPPEQQENIFGAFAQINDLEATRGVGTGLGLTIARELVSLMQGEIGVSSEPGVGSTFWFTAIFGRAQQALVVEVSTPPRPTAKRRAGAKVLVVEDNAVNRAVIEAMLQRLQLDVALAHDAEAALVMLERQSYDAVLMDCRLPGMDGLEATRIIRRRGLLSRSGGAIPVIALTANAFEDDKRRALDAGMDAFLPKPIQIGALANTLDQWLVNLAAVDRESNAPRIRYDSQHESETA